MRNVDLAKWEKWGGREKKVVGKKTNCWQGSRRLCREVAGAATVAEAAVAAAECRHNHFKVGWRRPNSLELYHKSLLHFFFFFCFFFILKIKTH